MVGPALLPGIAGTAGITGFVSGFHILRAFSLVFAIGRHIKL